MRKKADYITLFHYFFFSFRDISGCMSWINFLKRDKTRRRRYVLEHFPVLTYDSEGSADNVDKLVRRLGEIKNFVCEGNSINENNEYDDGIRHIEQNLSINEKRNSYERKIAAREAADTSLFFRACAEYDTNFIQYCLDECGVDLDGTEFIQTYKRRMYCSYYDNGRYYGCYQFNCLSMDFPDEEKITPLMYVILREKYRAVKHLLRLGANVNFQTKHFRVTPLLLACRLGNIFIVKLLIDHGARVEHVDVLNRNCLMYALSDASCLYSDEYHCDFSHQLFDPLWKYYRRWRWLLSLINDGQLFHFQTTRRTTERMKAMINQKELVRNYTVLHYAWKIHYKPLVDLLIQYGAEISFNVNIYRNNHLGNVLRYFNDDHDINNSVEHKVSNFLDYCICNAKCFDYYRADKLLAWIIRMRMRMSNNNNNNNDNNSSSSSSSSNSSDRHNENDYYSEERISNACLIIYLEFFKNRKLYNFNHHFLATIYEEEEEREEDDYDNVVFLDERRYLKARINYEKYGHLLKDANQHSLNDDYLNLCLNTLGCNNVIVYTILSQRYKIRKTQLNNAKLVLNESLRILNDYDIILGNKLWRLIFAQLSIIFKLQQQQRKEEEKVEKVTKVEVEDQKGTKVKKEAKEEEKDDNDDKNDYENDNGYLSYPKLIKILYCGLSRDIEKYLWYIKELNGLDYDNHYYNLFESFNKRHKEAFMFSIFEIAYIGINDGRDERINHQNFLNLLLLIERYNNGDETFNIFYEALKYVRYKIYQEEEEEEEKERKNNYYISNESFVLPRLIRFLNVLKNFNIFDAYWTVNEKYRNRFNILKYEHIHITSPLALALLSVTICERLGRKCKHVNKKKYIDLINFFDINNNDIHIRDDVFFFIHNFNVLGDFRV